MSIARQVMPIKMGLLMDMVLPAPSSWDPRQDMLDGLRLVFDDATATGVLDRPVEVVLREVEGLPRGTVKSVIDAYRELADEGCLGVFGPMISENAIAVKEEIERSIRVPSISMCGLDRWHGEWTFSLSNGSLTDEPYVIANLMARAGQKTAGVLVERSLIGPEYLRFFRDACRVEGITILGEASIAQTGLETLEQVKELHATGCDALVHWGFGLGVVRVNEALEELGWDPPRYMSTAFENGYMNDEIFRAHLGWIGLEQYDETNKVGQAFLDRFAETYGRRPEYYFPVCVRDAGESFVQALAHAEPLSPRGVMEALERVKMLPAAAGSPGTRISFGKWTRRGWMGAGYLVARSVNPDLKSTVCRGRYGQD